MTRRSAARADSARLAHDDFRWHGAGGYTKEEPKMGTIKAKKAAAKVAKVTKKATKAASAAKPVKAAKKPAKKGGCKSCGK